MNIPFFSKEPSSAERHRVMVTLLESLGENRFGPKTMLIELQESVYPIPVCHFLTIREIAYLRHLQSGDPLTEYEYKQTFEKTKQTIYQRYTNRDKSWLQPENPDEWIKL